MRVDPYAGPGGFGPGGSGGQTRRIYLPDASSRSCVPGPGACPICGMALEPREAAAEDGNPELAGMTRRFRISLAFTVPTLLIMVARLIAGHPVKRLLSSGVALWLEFVLATPVVLWGGWPFFERGWASVVNRSLNMFTLIALGTGAAYVYSVVATARARDSSRRRFAMRTDEVAVYFEAAAVITTLVLLGQVLELRARSRTSARDSRAAGTCAARRRACHRADGIGAGRAARAILRPATGCACGPARRFRWTAWCSKARARSTNR